MTSVVVTAAGGSGVTTAHETLIEWIFLIIIVMMEVLIEFLVLLFIFIFFLVILFLILDPG